MAPKDLALRRSDQRLAPISAYRRPFPPILKVASLSTVGAQKLVGTLPEMVQTIVPKDFTQYCSSPPLCTMISYGYTLSLGRIFCLIGILNQLNDMHVYDVYCENKFRGCV